MTSYYSIRLPVSGIRHSENSGDYYTEKCLNPHISSTPKHFALFTRMPKTVKDEQTPHCTQLNTATSVVLNSGQVQSQSHVSTYLTKLRD